MGRPKKKGPTVKVRCYKSMVDELKLKFPRQDMSDLLDISYNTSALKLEAVLRKPPRKKDV